MQTLYLILQLHCIMWDKTQKTWKKTHTEICKSSFKLSL
jgi:hypothetical protein